LSSTSSTKPEPVFYEKGIELSENMTFKQLIAYLVNLEEKVSDMAEMLDLSSEMSSEEMT